MKTLKLLFVLLFVSSMAKAEADLLDPVLDSEEYCLALNMYYESRGSSIADQVAVSDVVINRVLDSRYPNTVCDVIRQGPTKPSWKTGNPIPIRNMCQFSWYCDGKPDIPLDTDAWHIAQELAVSVYNFNKFRGITEGATHYHSAHMPKDPHWAKDFTRVTRIGDHIFYRWE